MAEKAREHCWHNNGGYTNGNWSAGDTTFICCRCGVTESRAWDRQDDPKHGPHANPGIRVYRDSAAGACKA